MTTDQTAQIEAALRRDGLNPDEVRAVMAKAVEGVMPEHEDGTCRLCRGWGYVQAQTCMGSESRRCDNCMGDGHTLRIKVPVSGESKA